MSKKSDLSFFNQFSKYRTTASLLYDVKAAEGKSQQELMEALKPLLDQLDGFISSSVKNDLGGVILAINLLNNEVEKHTRDANFLLNKANDTKAQVEKLKNAIKADMKEAGHLERKQDDFWATLVGDMLTIR